MGRRILITGLSSFWGGRLAQAFEHDPSVEVIVGLDTKDPVVELERTEFVRADENFSILARLVRATRVDTVVHAALVVDSTTSTDRRVHEKNVIGTMNLLAAAGAGDSTVRSLVVKSSTLVYGAGPKDPTWFDEQTERSSPARTRVERSLVEVESYLRAFREERSEVTVAVLRFANVLGEQIVTAISRALSLPLVPKIAGFDPQMQFVEEDDVVRAIEYVVDRGLEGVFNVAGDGRLPWSEICALLGKRALPLSPLFSGPAAAPLARLRLVELPPELRDLLRYGRGVDNTKLKATGFRYRYDTAGAVRHFAEAQRLRRAVGETRPTYRYENDVESFFRHSPAVVAPPTVPAGSTDAGTSPGGAPTPRR
ncbi:MAG: NAD-dependent epimerase/dehydratase family protein [Acidimicrobiales bacterium]